MLRTKMTATVLCINLLRQDELLKIYFKIEPQTINIYTG